jgi:hypothetical protein
MGVKFTDSNGKALPMLQIMEKLQGKLGDLTSASASAKLMEAFGGEGAQVITSLAKDTDRLRNGMDKLGKVRGLEDAENMAKAMVDPWQQFAAAVEALRIAFGQALIPILTPLMAKLSGIAGSMTRWTQMFPNITRVIGIVTLTILALIAAMSLLTFAIGAGRMAWLAMVTVWKVVQLLNLRAVAGFLLQVAVIALYVAGLTLLYTTMGIIRGGMLLWQAAIWLVNAAMWANPVLLIVAGVLALIAVITLAVVYWDEWTSALMNSEAFKWVSDQLTALSDWFTSMGGWSGMAKAAWDGIVAIFHTSINSLIEMLNKIPGVDIETKFGAMPEVPGTDIGVNTVDASAAAQKAQQTINSAIPSLSPARPNAVPPGGLLTSIQNNNSSQNKGTHVETLNINTAKPMTPLELENMMSMAVPG